MTKEKRFDCIKILKIIWRILGTICILAVPAISFAAFEYITGNLELIGEEQALLNIAWMYAIYGAAFTLSGTARIAVPVVSVFLYGLAVAETFVEEFRGSPIMIWDLMAVRTAMTVTENYVFEFSEEMKQVGYGLIAVNAIAMLCPVRVRGLKRRLLLLAGGSGAVACFAMQFFLRIVPQNGMEINMWSMNDTYTTSGYILSTAISMKYIVKKPPQGYSKARLLEIYEKTAYGGKEETEVSEAAAAETEVSETAAAVTEAETEKNGDETVIRPVNLICIMNESLSDLKAAGSFTTNQEYFPFINQLHENTVRGSLCVPVFGSMTSNTEFEFLTGDSIALLPSGSIAYQFYIKPGAETLVSTLKEQGYRTVAMHPYPGENWNRISCYENMGFDDFFYDEYYTGSETFRNYVSDRADFQKIIELIEDKKDPEEPLFVFNVTMQNHGGYEGTYDNFEQDVYLTGQYEGKYPKTDQYLSLVKKSDEAFQGLLEYFSDYEEPTMIVMFGDHQPSVEDEFFDEIAGKPSAEVPAAERIMWYQTPFLIWTNYEQPARDLGRLGAVYLSSRVLELAGLEMTPYNRFLLQMSEVLPVIHPIGCYDSEGTYYSWQEAESALCPYQEYVKDYEQLVYNHSMDRKQSTGMFALEEPAPVYSADVGKE